MITYDKVDSILNKYSLYYLRTGLLSIMISLRTKNRVILNGCMIGRELWSSYHKVWLSWMRWKHTAAGRSGKSQGYIYRRDSVVGRYDVRRFEKVKKLRYCWQYSRKGSYQLFGTLHIWSFERGFQAKWKRQTGSNEKPWFYAEH